MADSLMIHHGDLFDVLPTLEAESIDACVTDPPYDLTANKRGGSGEASLNLNSPAGRSRISTGGGFMGKEWDGQGVAFNVETWRQVYRVLKPGAHIVAFGGTRTFHRMTCAIEDAGFEIRDCLSWLYGQGFPKSMDISKAIDKAAGAERDVIGVTSITGDRKSATWRDGSGLQGNVNLATAPSTDAAKQWQGWGTALKPSWEPCILARKPFKGSVAANVQTHGTGALNIDATRIKPTSQDASRSSRDSNSGGTSIWREASQIVRNAGNNTEAWSDVAHARLASLLANALSRVLLSELSPNSQGDCLPCRGCDGGRVRFGEAVGRASVLRSIDARESLDLGWIASRIRGCRCADHPSIWDALARKVASGNYTADDVENTLGRWPANVCLDEEAARLVDEQSGLSEEVAPRHGGFRDDNAVKGTVDFKSGSRATYPLVRGDSGGASRFYYVAKPSREERDYGIYDLEPKSGGEATGRKDGSAGLTPRAGAGRTGGARNIHPTVKPVELMRWLVRLITPPGGVVLDPFLGSGTTGMACRYELREFIGIEREAEYVEIAKRRINSVAPLFADGAA